MYRYAVYKCDEIAIHLALRNNKLQISFVMKEYSFEKLEVYVEARALVKAIYNLSACFPDSERYALTDQIHRAVVSVTSNIAEGTSRTSKKDKAHFVEMAYGSLMEVVSQLQVAMDLNYISQTQYNALQPLIEKISYKLYALRQSFIDIK